MLGLFKKPDATKTTDECVAVWSLLTEKDKFSVANNILKYAQGLSSHCTDASDALLTLGHLKQGVIKKFELRDHAHPAYISLQILSDFIFSKKQGADGHEHTRRALVKISDPLGKTEQTNLFILLGKF